MLLLDDHKDSSAVPTGPPDRSRRRVRLGLLAAVLVALSALTFFSYRAHANHHETDIYHLILVPSERTDIYNQFTQTLTEHIGIAGRNNVRITSYTPVELSASIDKTGRFPEGDLVVPIGTKAALSVSSYSTATPVLFTLLPKSSYRAIVSRYRQNFPQTREYSALYLDQPFELHLGLAGAVLPDNKRIGILLGPKTRNLKHAIFSAARLLHLTVTIREIDREREIYTVLPILLNEVDTVLSIPDPLIYNNRTIRTILITTFRHKTPVIGYSKSFVKAGALAGIYSTPKQISRQVADIVTGLADKKSRSLPLPQPPRHYSIGINYWVAESLGIRVPGTDFLRSKLRQIKRHQTE